MANFKEVFRSEHVILPVVHVESTRQAIKNSEIAEENGCDGVFLISMRQMHHLDLLKVAHVVKDELPGFWIGVNFLDLETQYLFRAVDRKISGVWSDNAEIDETKELQDEASRIKDNRTTSKWQGLYFGGVAFKYQREVTDYAKAAKIAVNFVDVVTTSGEGTGHAPNPEKIQEIKQAIGTHPLAIASGISPENISRYTAADAFLVATSLLVRGTEDFDKFKVRDLVAAVR